MHNKKGFELALNTIVVLVLMLAIFAVGMWLATTIFERGEEFIDLSNEQLLNQYRGLSCGGGQVLCVSEKSFTLGYGQQKVVGVKIVNRLDKKMNFEIDGSESYIDTNPLSPANPSAQLNISYIEHPPILLQKGEAGVQLLSIITKDTTTEGTHIIKLVYDYYEEGGTAGSDSLDPLNIYVKVE